ncbi:MAG: glutathione synthase, partial [Polynucleobacter sp.]
MDFLFIADPLDSFAIQKDSTLAMMRAAQTAGHRLWFVETRGIVWKDNSVVADCRPLAIKP